MTKPICVDFDGTIVTHEYPRIGRPVHGAIDALKALMKEGHKIILFTMRSGVYLSEAVYYLEENGIELHGVNRNPDQEEWTSSPKAYGQVYIDDASIGCPIYHPADGSRPYVNWEDVCSILIRDGLLRSEVLPKYLGEKL